jgi:thiol-disulfide isomerase/thioredoxin
MSIGQKAWLYAFAALALAGPGLQSSGLLAAPSAVGGRAPEVSGVAWLNSAPQTLAGLAGRVVLVEFWTFGCYNCRNVEPHVKEWHRRYAERGLVVIGVHTPELRDERNVDSVRRYVHEHEIPYPVVVDNDFATWNRYGNNAWPTLYLVDKHGLVRLVRIGEGGSTETERTIEALLAES